MERRSQSSLGMQEMCRMLPSVPLPQDREPEYRWKGIKTDFHKTNKFVSNSPKSPYYNNQLSGLTFTQFILK